MATQRCPKCKSERVRLGYRPTSILSKLMFRYNLLCDQCNWEFSGFGIPGTVTTKTRKRKNNLTGELIAEDESENEIYSVESLLEANANTHAESAVDEHTQPNENEINTLNNFSFVIEEKFQPAEIEIIKEDLKILVEKIEENTLVLPAEQKETKYFEELTAKPVEKVKNPDPNRKRIKKKVKIKYY